MTLRTHSFVLASLLVPIAAIAAEDTTNYSEPGLSPGRQYVHEQFAERIDPFTGNLSLQHVDLRIPGSAGFDLRVRRTYNANAANTLIKSPFGRGWDINFGRIVHTSGHLNEVCSNAAAESMILELPKWNQGNIDLGQLKRGRVFRPNAWTNGGQGQRINIEAGSACGRFDPRTRA